jgi:hypothetical protein
MRAFFSTLLTLACFAALGTNSSAATNPYDDPECARLSLASKKKADACYRKALKETEELLLDHREGIEISSTIPPGVKQGLMDKYERAMKAIDDGCKDAECRNNEMRELDKLLYVMTQKYTGTGTPYR